MTRGPMRSAQTAIPTASRAKAGRCNRVPHGCHLRSTHARSSPAPASNSGSRPVAPRPRPSASPASSAQRPSPNCTGAPAVVSFLGRQGSENSMPNSVVRGSRTSRPSAACIRPTPASTAALPAAHGDAKCRAVFLAAIETTARQEKSSLPCAPPASARWTPSGVPNHAWFLTQCGPAITSTAPSITSPPRRSRTKGRTSRISSGAA